MDAFAKAGYGVGQIGWGRRAAVVVVDFQAAFTSPDYPLGGGDHITAAVRRAADVVAAARTAGVLVVHTAIAFSSAHEYGRWKVPALLGVAAGSPAAQIDPLVWDPSDLYLLKRHPSAFFGTDLNSILRRNDVDTVVVMGATTSGCIRATVVDSFSYGFRTLVVEDACGDQDADAHAANLRDVGRRYADVTDVHAVVDHLSQPREPAAAAAAQ